MKNKSDNLLGDKTDLVSENSKVDITFDLNPGKKLRRNTYFENKGKPNVVPEERPIDHQENTARGKMDLEKPVREEEKKEE